MLIHFTLCLEYRHRYPRFSAWSTGSAIIAIDPSPRRGLGSIAILYNRLLLSARRLVRLGAQGLGFGNRLVRLVAGGLGFGNRLGRLVAMGLGFGKPASEASSRGLGFGNRLGRLVAGGLGFGN